MECDMTGLEGKRVLLVEDQPEVAAYVTVMIEGLSCEVVGPACDLETALGLIGSEKIDAALIEPHLEGCASDEVTDLLKARAIPFAFTTCDRNLITERDRNATVLIEPFASDALRDTLAELLDGGREQGHGAE